MVDQETSSVHLSVQQAARYAGVSTKTIRRWLSSGRLRATFDGQAYAIDRDELDRAAASGRPTEVQPYPPRTVRTQSIVQDLLDRLERQAGEIATLRMERDQLADQLRALPAPASTQTAPLGATDTPASEPPPQPAARKRSWWRLW